MRQSFSAFAGLPTGQLGPHPRDVSISILVHMDHDMTAYSTFLPMSVVVDAYYPHE